MLSFDQLKTQCRDLNKMIEKYNLERLNVIRKNKTLTKQEWDVFFGKIENVLDYDSASVSYSRDETHSRQAWINEGIKEEIKACQGFHALTSEYHSSILDFLTKEASKKNKSMTSNVIELK